MISQKEAGGSGNGGVSEADIGCNVTPWLYNNNNAFIDHKESFLTHRSSRSTLLVYMWKYSTATYSRYTL